MSREERKKTQHDQVIQGQTRTRTLKKTEMKKLLEEKNIPARGTAKELAKLCEDHGILTKIISNKVIEGWEDKPKGILQTLWERGFIDATNLSNPSLCDGL
jgi:hypothetical protein